MIAFALGVLTTLTVLTLVLFVYPILGQSFIRAVWAVRGSNLFIWSVFHTYLVNKGWTTRPVMAKLTRQQRRNVERLRVRLGLL